MKFEIPFDREISEAQFALQWKETWGDFSKRNNRNLSYGTAVLLLGVLTLYYRSPYGWVFMGAAAYFLTAFFGYLRYQIKTKTNSIKNAEAYWHELENSGSKQVWEFHEDFLGFKDFQQEVKLKWPMVKNVRTIEGHCFLDLDVEGQSSYVIGMEEIGADRFKEVINFVKARIENNNALQTRSSHETD